MSTGTLKLLQKNKHNIQPFFQQKKSFSHYLLSGTLGTFVALMEAELQQLLYRVFFGGFRALTGTWALMNRRKYQNPPGKNPLR